MYANSDCLTNKLDELKSRLIVLKPDLVAIIAKTFFGNYFCFVVTPLL